LNEIAVAHVFLSSVLVNFKGNQAGKAVVLTFWMPNVSVGQPACSRITLQLAWPNRHDALRVRVPFQQIEWIELKGSVKQHFDVVQQQQVARGMLIGQLTQDGRGLQATLPLRHAREKTAQLGPDIQRCDTPACRKASEECSLARMGRPDEQHELAVQCRDFIDQLTQLDQRWG
jgi:hypothetical protein